MKLSWLFIMIFISGCSNVYDKVVFNQNKTLLNAIKTGIILCNRTSPTEEAFSICVEKYLKIVIK